jgi:anthranilate synthase component 1
MKLPKIKLKKKPDYIKLSNDMDFFELFRKIEAEFDNCFVLESLNEDVQFSRYAIIGFDPQLILKARGNELSIVNVLTGKEEIFEVDNPYYALREIIPQDIIARDFVGGLVGYLSYDAANYMESAVKIKQHPDFEQFKFGMYLDGLIQDKLTGETHYFFYDQNRIELVEKIISTQLKKQDHKPSVVELGDTLTKEQHTLQVNQIKEDIKAGLIFQCEVGFKTEFEIKGDKLQIYQKLRQVNPSPFMYYLKFSDQVIIGASPELIFRLKHGEMESAPLAGTIKRGRDFAEDQKLARDLLNDPKEVAEHSMLVDLHRNDMGRVAQFGTVKIRNLMTIKKFSHVQHIASEIVGIIKKGEDMFSALASNFPMGTVTGAPKIESMLIIESNEKQPRGPYAGGVGYFGFNGNCTFAVALRNLFVHGDHAFAQTSGGIVYDSIPEKEYDEIQRKLAAMKIVLTDFISK